MTEVTDLAPTVAIIVNFRTPGATMSAIHSLQRSSVPLDSIIVVDNGSGDGSVEQIRAASPEVTLLEEPANGGFSAGCNVGIRFALDHGAEHVLLLNSDAIVTPTALATLKRVLRHDAGLGIVGPLVVSHREPELIESNGIRYSSASGRMLNLEAGGLTARLVPPALRDVDAVNGAAMLIVRDVFDRIGLLDEEYFFGFEDVDFCLRARAAGYRCAVTSSAIVEHESQSSIGKGSPQRIYFATRNHLLLARKAGRNASPTNRTLRTIAILFFNLLHVLFTANVPRASGLKAFFWGAQDYFSNTLGSGDVSEPLPSPAAQSFSPKA